MWVDQWPLSKEKIDAAQQLVQEQLELGHIEQSNSPWNSPIFVIKKKSGKWSLLQDLRKVNETMEVMGTLQPGLPSPMAIPRNAHIIILDLKDCFYTIPQAPQDCPRFAFSVPSVNFSQPMRRYHWKVLPQGMANSPTLCQKFVAAALQETRAKFSDAYILHYMDDILLVHIDKEYLLAAYAFMEPALKAVGLIIAKEKVQTFPLYSYLGFPLERETFGVQPIALRRDNLKTLNDFQKLLGDINWIRPYLHLATYELKPLFDILKGDNNPTSPHSLTEAGERALQKVETALSQQHSSYCDYERPWGLYILASEHSPTGVLFQDNPLRWIYLPVSPLRVLSPYHVLVAKVIAKGRQESVTYLGRDPHFICIPFSTEQQLWLSQFSDDWAIALAQYAGEIKQHYPANKLLQFAQLHQFIFPKVVQQCPLKKGTTVFTDGSSNGIASLVIENESYYCQTSYSSA